MHTNARLIFSSLAVVVLFICGAVPSVRAQTDSDARTNHSVPNLLKFNGTAKDADGKPLSGVVGITFALYRDEQNGAVLWMETQNVQADAAGRYNVSLGLHKPLPVELFKSGDARWLGMQVSGEQEGNRVLLVSVPYAIKAGDAESLGGLPPSAYLLAPIIANPANGQAEPGTLASAAPKAAIAGTGTTNFLPLWTNPTTLGSSTLFQSGGQVGIGNTAPAATLDVTGGEIIRGLSLLPASGKATAANGFPSYPQEFAASAFNKKAIDQRFRFQAEPVGNNTKTPSATLNLLFGAGVANPSETGFSINNKGLVTFAPGQTFPGGGSGGSGTVTSVALKAPTEFTVTGSPVTTAGSLTFAWKVPPSSANKVNAIVVRDAAGAFSANSISTSNLTATGVTSHDIAVVDLSASDIVNVNSTNFNAVVGQSSSTNAVAITALATATTGPARGMEGQTFSSDPSAAGVVGLANATTGSAQGVTGVSLGFWGVGTLGHGGSGSFSAELDRHIGNFPIGAVGDVANGGIAILATADDSNALLAVNNSSADTMIAVADGDGRPFQALGPTGHVYINGAGIVDAVGYVTHSPSQSRMDHPLDPTQKYLNHAAIESSETLNLYSGNVVLGADGSSVIRLPDWFTTINGDFRYQLTPIGGFAQIYIAEEITNNQFRIAGGRAGMKVSWQVTGIRQDAYTKMHPLVVESAKEGEDRGLYIHPEAFGQGKEMGVHAMQRAKLPSRRAGKAAAGQVK